MKQKKITIFEAFSGIGSQHKALTNLSQNQTFTFESVGISEWFIDAIIAYAKIHHTIEYATLLSKIRHPKTYLDKKDILLEYSNINGYDFSIDSKTIIELTKIKESVLQMLYAANYVSKNKGSISAMVGADMPKNLDIFTYSFPCQDISVAGKMIGFDKDSGSRSSLVWQILRILDEAKKIGRLPKVLLMENVKALFSSKFISDWIAIKDILNDLGYDSFDTTINAIDKGSIQSRERVFSVAILRNGNLSNKFFFNNNIIKNSLVINDILSHKMKLDTYDKHFAQETNYTFQPSLDKYLLKRFYTKKSGIKVSKLVGYSVYNMSNLVYHPMGKCPTILADGGNSKLKILNMQTKTIRLLTPLETWRLMGFDLNDYINLISEWNHNDIINKATKKNYKISKHNLYKLAGNSIVIEVLEDIFSDILGKVFDILYDL